MGTGDHNLAFKNLFESKPDPGNAGVLAHNGQNCAWALSTTTSGAETRTITVPDHPGQLALISFDVDDGDLAVTCASAINQSGHVTATFAEAGEYLLLIGAQVAGANVWRVLGLLSESEGPTLS